MTFLLVFYFIQIYFKIEFLVFRELRFLDNFTFSVRLYLICTESFYRKKKLLLLSNLRNISHASSSISDVLPTTTDRTAILNF